MRQPSLFLSHGSPMTVISDTPARHFLEGLGGQLEKPDAIIVASAHFEARQPVVSIDPAPGMIYDFGGFPQPLYEMVYPAPGSPELGLRAAELLAAAGLNPAVVKQRGFDHGTWTPLILGWPEADIPVVQISVTHQAPAAHHIAIGRALAPLRDENVLVIGSGTMTHNLHAFAMTRFLPDPQTQPWATAFVDWMHEALVSGDEQALADYREKAPFAPENHPTDEHLMPIFVAYGAGGPGARGTRIHSSIEGGLMAMDCYRFA